MCLAVPGKILSIHDSAPAATRTGTVDFQGSRVETGLVLTPDAQVGDWVLVHAGFAIQIIDEADVWETWKYLEANYPAASAASQKRGEP